MEIYNFLKVYLQSTGFLLHLATIYKLLETKSSPTIYKKFHFFLVDSTTQNTPNLQPTKGGASMLLELVLIQSPRKKMAGEKSLFIILFVNVLEKTRIVTR